MSFGIESTPDWSATSIPVELAFVQPAQPGENEALRATPDDTHTEEIPLFPEWFLRSGPVYDPRASHTAEMPVVSDGDTRVMPAISEVLLRTSLRRRAAVVLASVFVGTLAGLCTEALLVNGGTPTSGKLPGIYEPMPSTPSPSYGGVVILPPGPGSTEAPSANPSEILPTNPTSPSRPTSTPTFIGS